MAFSFMRFLIAHSDIPHWVRLLWRSDQPVAETSTWQHTTLKPTDIHAPGGIRTYNLSRRAAADSRLRPRGHRDLWFVFTYIFKLGKIFYLTTDASYFPSARRTMHKAFVMDVSGAKENISMIFKTVSKVLICTQLIAINYIIIILNIKIFNNKQPQLSDLSCVYVVYRRYTNIGFNHIWSEYISSRYTVRRLW
jgi:hypothetical protein